MTNFQWDTIVREQWSPLIAQLAEVAHPLPRSFLVKQWGLNGDQRSAPSGSVTFVGDATASGHCTTSTTCTGIGGTMRIAALIIGIDGWEKYTKPLVKSYGGR